MVNFFFDSYAIVEIIKGNPSYSRYVQEPVTITIFNLAEIYWVAYNDLSEAESYETYSHYKQCVIDIEDEVLSGAIKFRKIHKKKNLSYADCIGYICALKHNLVFLTGDKEFKNMENVEFVL